MAQKKFQYENPKNTDERIEAIYDEFCSTPISNNRQPLETLKDYLIAILAHKKRVEQNRKVESGADGNEIRIALSLLAVIASIFLWLGVSKSDDWEWLGKNQFPLRLWGIAFAAIFIGVSIEQSSLFRRLWEFGFTKVVASVAVSALLIFSTGKASSLINALFGVDASIFPFTRAFIAGMLAFQYCSPLLIVIVLFAIVHALDVAGYIKSKWKSTDTYDFPPLRSIAFLAFTSVILLVSWQFINHDFSEAKLPTKIYRLAHVLDFNSRHSCVNIKEGVNVVFVGSDHSKVLVDLNGVTTESMEKFLDQKGNDSIAIPNKFFLLPCNLGARPD